MLENKQEPKEAVGTWVLSASRLVIFFSVLDPRWLEHGHCLKILGVFVASDSHYRKCVP